jgi:hypothetical protein
LPIPRFLSNIEFNNHSLTPRHGFMSCLCCFQVDAEAMSPSCREPSSLSRDPPEHVKDESRPCRTTKAPSINRSVTGAHRRDSRGHCVLRWSSRLVTHHLTCTVLPH